MTDQPVDREVLPTQVTPCHYELRLKPDIEAARFEGRVFITLDVHEDTNEVVLNAAEMDIFEASVLQDHKILVASPALDERTEQLTLTFPSVIRRGSQAYLDIRFRGNLNDRMVGFYRSEFKRPDGTTSLMATTQFEPHHARRCFPCWDEPGRKATFRLEIEAPLALAVVSNTPIVREYWHGTTEIMKTTIFKTTPPMSTYLLAFVVGELEKISDRTDDGVELNFWARPGKAEQCRFALEVTKKVLAHYDEYFGISYGSVMRQLNQIAIPDFSFGAMENWGCITYREIRLLVSEDSSEAMRRAAAETIAHEIAHQWFGNLVTMQWWNNLWLNESFATWLATDALDHAFPEWKPWLQFVHDEVTSAMSLDGQDGTHPIEVPIPRAADIDEVFDAISYAKGGSVLRMLAIWLGKDGFRDGLRLYMKRHAFGNTVAADLWNALAEANPGRPVANMMRDWTAQAGYPVVKCACRELDGVTSLEVEQERFRLKPDAGGDSATWPIPLTVSTGDAFLMDSDCTTRVLPADAFAPGQHLLVNCRRSAFCRVAYDAELWSRLVDAVRAGRITSAEERYALQADAAALAHTGQMPATALFEMASAYTAETEGPVWLGLLGSLGEMIGLLEWEQGLEDVADAFVRSLIGRITGRLGWEKRPGEDPGVATLRACVLTTAVTYGETAVIQEALRIFRSGGAIDPNLLGPVYGAVARHGGTEGYEQLLARYRAADDAESRVCLLTALGRAKDPALKRRTLELALSDEVRKQDAVTPVYSVASGATGARLAWRFVRERWEEICRSYKGNNAKIGYFMKTAAKLASREELSDAQEFLDEHPVEGLAMTAAQTLARLEINCRWREANVTPVATWLARWANR